MSSDNETMSRTEAAKVLCVDRVTVGNYLIQGKLNGTKHKVGGVTIWLISRDSVESLKKERDNAMKNKGKAKTLIISLQIHAKKIREGQWEGLLVVDGKNAAEVTGDSQQTVQSGLLFKAMRQVLN